MENKSYDKILIATDGSINSEGAIDSGLEIARLSGAKVYALYVMAPTGFTLRGTQETWVKEVYNELSKEGKEATEYIKQLGEDYGLEVEAVMLEGNPSEMIIDFADENEIDLIVMGTHGKTGLQKFLIGSVAEKVVRNSNKEVLVVRGPSPSPEALKQKKERIKEMVRSKQDVYKPNVSEKRDNFPNVR
ncbi:universal stress protein [Methanohalobium sp.]|uniref:universal stress protein n=1 Tax=Methanohalobium sp. TaxID=2837493 RepID=UPI003182FC27